MVVRRIAVWCRWAGAGTVICMAIRTLTPAVAALAADVSTAVRSDAPAIDVARHVASALAPALVVPDLLDSEHKCGRTQSYTQHILYVDPESAPSSTTTCRGASSASTKAPRRRRSTASSTTGESRHIWFAPVTP